MRIRFTWRAALAVAVWTLAPVSFAFGSPLFSESFDSATAPALPAGWSVADTVGTSGNWTTAATVEGSALPHSGQSCAVFNGAAANGQDACRLYRTVGVNTSSSTVLALHFWSFNSSIAGNPAYVKPVASFDGGGTWTEVVTYWSIYRGGTPGEWQENILNADSLIGHASVRLGFEGISGNGSSDLYIDDVQLTPTVCGCTPNEGSVGTAVRYLGAGFGSTPGQVMVGTFKGPFKITSWSDQEIDFVVTKPFTAGRWSVEPVTKARGQIYTGSTFTFKDPAAGAVTPSTASIGATVQLSGKYFGPKAGKITLVNNTGVKLVKKSCKALTWTMDATTGDCLTTFVVPKGLAAGVYEVHVGTAAGDVEFAQMLTVN